MVIAPLDRRHVRTVSHILTVAQLSSAPEPIVQWFMARSFVRWIGAFVDDRLVGTGMLTLLGRTAWLGNIAVLPAWRRRGFGHRLTEELVAYALVAGAESVLLIATADGYPVYRSLGFEATDTYTEWMLPTPGPEPHPSLRAVPLTADADVMLDRWATGEDRTCLWNALPSEGWAWFDGDGLKGFQRRTLLHDGLIVARSISVLTALLGRVEGPWVIRDGLGLTDWCVRRGAKAGERTTRMALQGRDPLTAAAGLSAGLISYACG